MDSIRENVLDKGMGEFVLRIFAMKQNTAVLNETKQPLVIICTVLGSQKLTEDARDQTLVLKDIATKASLADLDLELHCLNKESRYTGIRISFDYDVC